LGVIDVSSYNVLNNMSSTINNNRLGVIDVSSYNVLNNISTNGLIINGSLNQPIQTDPSGYQIMKFYPTNTDAFGRLRSSYPYTLFEGANINLPSQKFSNITSGSGTTTYDVNNSAVNLNVTNSGVGHVIREGKTCTYYQPGKSLFSMFTFCMDTPDINLRQMLGYYDCSNGFFFDVCGTTAYFTRRSNVSGVVSETQIPQSSWNTNKYSSLNTTKSQILWIDMEWLGVGSVRMGFVVDGQFILCHQFNHANNINSVYITTPNLPPRYEIISTGNLTKTLKSFCCTILSEGGFEFRGIKNIIDTGINQFSLGSAGTVVPLIAIRINPAYLNAIVIPSLISLLPISNANVSYRLLINPTITVSSWTTFSNSCVQYALTSNLSGLIGGTVVGAGYSNTASIIDIGDNKFDLQLGRTLSNINSYTFDILVLCGIGLTNNQNVYAMLGWNEM